MGIRFSKRWVTIPWFRVGEPELDLPATVETIRKAISAKRGK